ncbi:hypothetical protein [Natronobiforma cellulositropha]
MFDSLSVATDAVLMMDIAVWITAVVVVAGTIFTAFIVYLALWAPDPDAPASVDGPALETEPGLEVQETD